MTGTIRQDSDVYQVDRPEEAEASAISAYLMYFPVGVKKHGVRGLESGGKFPERRQKSSSFGIPVPEHSVTQRLDSWK